MSEWKPRSWEEAIKAENLLVWLQNPHTSTFAILDQLTGDPDFGFEFNRRWVARYGYNPAISPDAVRQLAIDTMEEGLKHGI